MSRLGSRDEPARSQFGDVGSTMRSAGMERSGEESWRTGSYTSVLGSETRSYLDPLPQKNRLEELESEVSIATSINKTLERALLAKEQHVTLLETDLWAEQNRHADTLAQLKTLQESHAQMKAYLQERDNLELLSKPVNGTGNEALEAELIETRRMLAKAQSDLKRERRAKRDIGDALAQTSASLAAITELIDQTAGAEQLKSGVTRLMSPSPSASDKKRKKDAQGLRDPMMEENQTLVTLTRDIHAILKAYKTMATPRSTERTRTDDGYSSGGSERSLRSNASAASARSMNSAASGRSTSRGIGAALNALSLNSPTSSGSPAAGTGAPQLGIVELRSPHERPASVTSNHSAEGGAASKVSAKSPPVSNVVRRLTLTTEDEKDVALDRLPDIETPPLVASTGASPAVPRRDLPPDTTSPGAAAAAMPKSVLTGSALAPNSASPFTSSGGASNPRKPAPLNTDPPASQPTAAPVASLAAANTVEESPRNGAVDPEEERAMQRARDLVAQKAARQQRAEARRAQRRRSNNNNDDDDTEEDEDSDSSGRGSVRHMSVGERTPAGHHTRLAAESSGNGRSVTPGSSSPEKSESASPSKSESASPRRRHHRRRRTDGGRVGGTKQDRRNRSNHRHRSRHREEQREREREAVRKRREAAERREAEARSGDEERQREYRRERERSRSPRDRSPRERRRDSREFSDDYTDYSDVADFPEPEVLMALGQHFFIGDMLQKNRDAAVFRARSIDSNDDVVVKIIADPEFSPVFPPREVRIISRLGNFPSIPPLLAWYPFEESGCYAIVIPFIHSLPMNGSDPVRLQKYMWDILQTLHHCHQNNIIYRDIKPENILFDESTWRAYVIDYDCSLEYNPYEPPHDVCGTDGYMAPEVMDTKRRGNTYSFPCDIYSAGVLFYEFLFNVSNPGYTEHWHMEEAVARMKDSSPAVRLLAEMIQYDPSRRITAHGALQSEYFSDLRSRIGSYASPARTPAAPTSSSFIGRSQSTQQAYSRSTSSEYSASRPNGRSLSSGAPAGGLKAMLRQPGPAPAPFQVNITPAPPGFMGAPYGPSPPRFPGPPGPPGPWGARRM